MEQPQRRPTILIAAIIIHCAFLLTGCSESENTPASRPGDVEVRSEEIIEIEAETPRNRWPSKRNVDVAVMEWRGKDIGKGNSKRDVDKQAPFRINVYQGKSHSSVNRIEVDLGRNGTYDEQWAFRQGNVFMENTPDSSGKLTRTFEWTNGAWHEQKR